jgi:SSS family solute:Na+ symporter
MYSIWLQALLFAVPIAFLIGGFLHRKAPRTVREYALGNGNFSTITLICTAMAGSFGAGHIIGKTATLYQTGAWLFIASLAGFIGDCLTPLMIIPRITKYYGCLSIAEIIGQMYGAYARRLVGILAFICCIGVVGTQIRILHWIMEQVFVQYALVATAIGAFIIILYSGMGGISSFIKTSIVHFFIVMVILPLVAIHVIGVSGGITTIANYLHESSSKSFFHGGSITTFIAFTLIYLLPNIGPGIFHRLLIGKDRKKNQSAEYALAFVFAINTIFIGCVAFIALARFPSIEPRHAIFVVIQNFFTAKWGIILFTVALISIIIASTKFFINT